MKYKFLKHCREFRFLFSIVSAGFGNRKIQESNMSFLKSINPY
jgi:hypothetical protein